MHDQQLVTLLNKELAIQASDTMSEEEIVKIVKQKVNELLQTDFNALLTLLYRIDVNEEKLKWLLETNRDKDAADIISGLIIERQLQKIKSRKAFKTNSNNISEEDKW